MQKINREAGKTIIIVTHNSAIAEMAHRVVRLHDGQVAAVETVEAPRDAESLKW